MIKGKSEYIPSVAIPPGETILELLDSYRMTQKELAIRLGMASKTVNEIINGKAPITHDTALKLESIFGAPASFWNNLETNYRETLARLNDQKSLTEEAVFLKEIPYKELVDHGWIDDCDTKEEKVINLRRFFRVGSLNSVPNTLNVACRSSYKSDTSIYALATWLQVVTDKANEVDLPKYNATKLKNSIPEIKRLSKESPTVFVPRLKEIFNSCGVAFFILPHFKNTKIQGVAKWINPNKAVIAMTIRQKFADIFWFSLMHEVGHILKHKKKETFVSDENISVRSEFEDEADEFASQSLIPETDYSEFVSKGNYSRGAILQFSKAMDIHPCIVVGRLQRNKLVPYNRLNDLKIRYTW